MKKSGIKTVYCHRPLRESVVTYRCPHKSFRTTDLLVTEPLTVVIYLMLLQTGFVLMREALFISLASASWYQYCLLVSCVETSIHLCSVTSPLPLPPAHPFLSSSAFLDFSV